MTSKDRSEPQSPSPPRRALAADVETLERELARMNEQLAETEEALAELERLKAEIGGAATNVRQAMEELERNLAERRDELVAAEREQVTQELSEALSERDAIALRLAASLAPILDDIEALDDARSRAAAAQATLHKLDGPRAVRQLPPEPIELVERWKWLMTRVGAEFDENMVDELVEAAARSPLGHAIEDLPAHLREAARRRRRLLLNRSRPGAGDEAVGARGEPE